MGSDWGSYAVIAVGSLLGSTIATAFAMPILAWSVPRRSGWRNMEQDFAQCTAMPATKLRKQSAFIGKIWYWRSINIKTTPEGLHLVPIGQWYHKPLMVPWTAVTGLQELCVKKKQVVEFDIATSQGAVHVQLKKELADSLDLARHTAQV